MPVIHIQRDYPRADRRAASPRSRFACLSRLRGLVRFSAERLRHAARTPAENTDLTPSCHAWRLSRVSRGLACLVAIAVLSGATADAANRSAKATGSSGGTSTNMSANAAKLHGTNSREAAASALQSIPFEKLDADARAKARKILSGNPIFRRMPIHATQCDPELFLFLVRHPDVVVGIWESLELSNMRLEWVGPKRYRTTDDQGTVGTVEFLYEDFETHVVHTEGKFVSPLLAKPVTGRSLLVLKTGYVRETNGKYYVTNRLDSFTQIDNVGLDFITRTLQPIVGKVADSNFLQTSAFVGSLSRSAERDQRRMLELASSLKRVQPQTRREFAALTTRMAQRAASQSASATRQVSHVSPLAADPPASDAANAADADVSIFRTR